MVFLTILRKKILIYFFLLILLCHVHVYSQHSSIIWPVWLNSWAFVYELSGCGFESVCSHLNFRFRDCLEQGLPWHSGNYRVWVLSETRTWHDKKYSQTHRTDKQSQHSSINLPIWLNYWVVVYELSNFRFDSSCSHLEAWLLLSFFTCSHNQSSSIHSIDTY